MKKVLRQLEVLGGKHYLFWMIFGRMAWIRECSRIRPSVKLPVAADIFADRPQAVLKVLEHAGRWQEAAHCWMVLHLAYVASVLTLSQVLQNLFRIYQVMLHRVIYMKRCSVYE